jgi:hypothetical protein
MRTMMTGFCDLEMYVENVYLYNGVYLKKKVMRSLCTYVCDLMRV